MTAPERIWAFYAPEIADDNDGATIVAHENIQHGAKEYTRADLHDATKWKLATAVAVLRDMVDHADEISSPLIAARAVLAEIEKGEPK